MATQKSPANARQASKLAVHGDVLDFSNDPGSYVAEPVDHNNSDNQSAVRFTQDGWLLIEDEHFAGVQPATFQPASNWQVIEHRGQLICPGFIDTHVHSGQLDVIASYGTDLLDWLDQYTFPNESCFADLAFAQEDAQFFCDALLSNGTTTAAVFPTSHAHSVDALFQAASERGMCLITGKVLMDRHAPQELLDGSDLGNADSRALIKRWHGRQRLHYAVTPRFAPTSTDAQLAMAGQLVHEFEGVYLQTHVAENTAEMAWVAELFKQDRSYLSVYERHGLLGPRSLLAHGIWLDDADRAIAADTGTSIVFCPSSNMFLGSGLFDMNATRASGTQVALASDVGGGTHHSMLRVMADASRVMALTGQKLTAFQAFYQATLGAANALQLGNSIGSFDTGKHADFVVLNNGTDPIQQRRLSRARSLHERLYAMMMLGDAASVEQTYIGGRPQCTVT